MTFFNLKSYFKELPRVMGLGSLFLVLLLIVINFYSLKIFTELTPYQEIAKWGSGGPLSSGLLESGALLGQGIYPKEVFGEEENFVLLENASPLGSSSPLSNILPFRDGLLKYKVKKGDTLSGLAAQFSLSLETIRYANPNTKSSLSPGETLTILPVSGIIYETSEGDSLEAVVSRYNVSAELIKKYNPNYLQVFESPNQIVILPFGKPIGQAYYRSDPNLNLPEIRNYFALPARGFNWGELHEYNGVDIADACGNPIYASAEGMILEEEGNNQWNQGYGNYIILEHPNSTKTRYAHTAKNLVSKGDYVSQGDKIGLMGNTGRTHGPSGCHLHFEVLGAKNPFAIR